MLLYTIHQQRSFRMARQRRKSIKFLFSLLIFFYSTARAQEGAFQPAIKEFNGYVYDIFNDNVFFFCFSKYKHYNLNFKYNKNNKKISFIDTGLIILFIGSRHPEDLNSIYQNRRGSDPVDNLPFIKSKGTFFNTGDSTNCYIRYVKAHFTAFDYKEYKLYEHKYGSLHDWGIFAKTFIYPENIISNNKYYIVNYFYKRFRF